MSNDLLNFLERLGEQIWIPRQIGSESGIDSVVSSGLVDDLARFNSSVV